MVWVWEYHVSFMFGPRVRAGGWKGFSCCTRRNLLEDRRDALDPRSYNVIMRRGWWGIEWNVAGRLHMLDGGWDASMLLVLLWLPVPWVRKDIGEGGIFFFPNILSNCSKLWSYHCLQYSDFLIPSLLHSFPRRKSQLRCRCWPLEFLRRFWQWRDITITLQET